MDINIRVSMVYMKTHPKSTLIPYPIQLFGTIQWKKEPVIIAYILQALNTKMAVRLIDTLKSVTSVHLARVPMKDDSLINGEEDS
ncbi:hypothetical protein RR46_08784 [Papilio xuthus]|uniref:Uncharacterized protein n=1 Tax=Papilio xuthus TaxID=66420 RepID=A0A194PW16_PAPXU|nr:hypothetical protein RR46_08784 [Papilio xuthus]